jgi:hypothetical protein
MQYYGEPRDNQDPEFYTEYCSAKKVVVYVTRLASRLGMLRYVNKFSNPESSAQVSLELRDWMFFARTMFENTDCVLE